MSKKLSSIAIGTICFVSGVVLSWISVGEVRQIIRLLYQLTTGNAFQFHGKTTAINLDPFYYSIWGLVVLILWICIKGSTLKKAILWTGIAAASFFVTVILYTWVNGNLRIMSCTQCDNGILKLHRNDLQYNLITEIGLITGITPFIILTIRKRKKTRLN